MKKKKERSYIVGVSLLIVLLIDIVIVAFNQAVPELDRLLRLGVSDDRIIWESDLSEMPERKLVLFWKNDDICVTIGIKKQKNFLFAIVPIDSPGYTYNSKIYRINLEAKSLEGTSVEDWLEEGILFSTFVYGEGGFVEDSVLIINTDRVKEIAGVEEILRDDEQGVIIGHLINSDFKTTHNYVLME